MTDQPGTPDDLADLGPEITADTLNFEGPESAIARLEAEAAQWKDQALRAVAEADNTRRRAEREMNDARAFAIQRFARDLMGVADNLSRALAAAPREDTDAAVKNLVLGLDMTEKALQQAFESNGLKRLAPQAGDKFDPHHHQAMSEQAADDVPPGAVVQTLQDGYELFGRVVRPAMVMVAAKSASTQAAGASAYAKAAGATAGDGVDTEA